MDNIHYLTFSFFQSNRTPRECADWCDTFDTCHGFAVVQEGFISGINKCWLKTKLTYPPPYPNREGVLIYYKVNRKY